MAKPFSIILASFKMATATFFSRVLGLIREQVMASMFGASGLTDAFLVAYRIPNLLRDLFAEGAFSSAFVPTFVEAKNQAPEKAKELLWSLFIILLILTSFISILTMIFAPEIINIFAPTFGQDNSFKYAMTVNLTRIMAPFLTFVSLAALFMGALNSLKIFFIPALAPACFNITMIFSMILGPLILNNYALPAIYSLGVGVFLGGLIQAFIQLPLIIRFHYGFRWPKKIWTPLSSKVIKLLGPGLLGFAATQLNLIVNTILASGAAVGAVSWLSYSFRLFQFPVGILSVSLGNSNLVHFSDLWKSHKVQEAKESFLSTYMISYIIIAPAMVALVVFAPEIVNVVFQRGRFDWGSTIMTAKALRWYALGLPFYGIYKITVPTLYAMDHQRVPVMASVFSVLANIVFCVMLTPKYGFEVLAMGTTLSMLINSSIQVFFIKVTLDFNWADFFQWRWLRIIFTTALVTALSYFLKTSFNFYEHHFFLRVWFLFLELLFVALSYFGLLYILGERKAVKFIITKLRVNKKS